MKLLPDIFAYANVQAVVISFDENRVHVITAEGDAEIYADDEIERSSEKIFHENRELETDFTKDYKSCQPTCDKEFSALREKKHKTGLIDHYLQYQSKEHTNFVKEYNFR